MKLRSNLFVVTLTLLTVFTFLILSMNCEKAFAQINRQVRGYKRIRGQTKPKRQVLVTFVEIGSVNCIPCKAMQPIMKAVEEEYKGQVKIVFHDVWTQKGKAGCRRNTISGLFPHRSFWTRTERNISVTKDTFQRMTWSECSRCKGSSK